MNSIINVERNTVIKSVLFLVFNTPFFMIKNFVRSKNLINKRVNVNSSVLTLTYRKRILIFCFIRLCCPLLKDF